MHCAEFDTETWLRIASCVAAVCSCAFEVDLGTSYSTLLCTKRKDRVDAEGGGGGDVRGRNKKILRPLARRFEESAKDGERDLRGRVGFCR